MKKIRYNKEYLKKLYKELNLVPLTYDFAFKKIFANDLKSNYYVLKKFLISVLRLDLNPDKCNIAVLCNELPKENKNEYRKTLDINVLLNNNIHLDIEMNRSPYNQIVTRNGLYESKLFTMAFESGTKNDEFLKQYIYQLNLNDYEKVGGKDGIEELIGEDIIAFTSIKTGNIYLKNRITILKYLDYYRNLYYNCPNECGEDELWLALLTSKNFSELNEYLEKLLSDPYREKFIKEAIDMSQDKFVLHAWQEEKMADLEKAEAKFYYENQLKEGIKKGIEQGIKQGKEEGRQEAILENIKSMFKNNIDIEAISKITNKPIKELKEIEKSLD